jgi:excisionase family DNA binding protein
MEYVTPREAARILAVSVSTLRRWENEGQIKSIKTPAGHRRYSIAQLENLSLAQKPITTVLYGRVSTSSQRDEAVDVYKPGSVTLITGKTIAHRYFVLNLMVEQLLNNEDSVCLFIPDQNEPEKTYELISMLGFKLDHVDKIKAVGLLASWTGDKNTRLIIPKSTDFDPDQIDPIIEMIESQEKITHVFIESIHAIPTYKVRPEANSLIRAIMVCLNCIARDKGIPVVMGCGDNNPDSKTNKLVARDLLFSPLLQNYSRLILGVDINFDDMAPLALLIYLLKGDHSGDGFPVLLDYYPGEALVVEPGKLPN